MLALARPSDNEFRLLAATQTYPFNRPANDNNITSGLCTRTKYTYAGLFAQTNTGLLLSTTRFYNPANGKWLNADPIREAGGINLTGYVGGSPVMGVDPLGLEGMTPIPIIDEYPRPPIQNWPIFMIQPVPGTLLVAMHGNPYAVGERNGSPVSVATLAIMIMGHPAYRPGMPVYLASCRTGQYPDGFAQQLANLLNADVIAPNKWFFMNHMPSMVIADKLPMSFWEEWIDRIHRYGREHGLEPGYQTPDRPPDPSIPGQWVPHLPGFRPPNYTPIPPSLWQ